MVGIACAAVCGMLAASLGIIPVELFLFLSLFLLLAALLIPRIRRSSPVVFAVVASTAAVWFMVFAGDLSRKSIHRLAEDPPKTKVPLIGRICSFPEFHPYASGSRGTWCFEVASEGICISNVWKTCDGRVPVRLPAASDSPPAAYGQKVLLHGRLKKPLFPGRSGLELDLDPGARLRDLSAPSRLSPSVITRAWRDSVEKNLEEGIEGRGIQQAVLKALVLGVRGGIPPEVTAIFRRTGSVHIFAISGLHVGIVGLLLMLLLKSFGIPRDAAGLFLVPLLFAYVVSTGMKPSALRALTMAAVFLLAPLFRRKPDIPSSVAAAALLLLVLRPAELCSAGFVFSFLVVIFIVMVFSVVPERVVQQGGVVRTYVVSLVITALAAGLASLPLTALYFGTFSPVALVGNLMVVPLTFFIVLSGWLSILVPAAAAIFNHAALVFIDLLLLCVGWLDRIPGSCRTVPPPPMYAVVLWYASWIVLFTHARNVRQRALALAGAGCAVLLALTA